VAKFSFNMVGIIFQDGAESIRRAYDVAVEALLAEMERKKEEAIQYQEYIDQGGPPIGEWEDGHALWTQDQALEIEVEMAQEQVQTARKAFVVMLYHHWERTAQIAGGKAKGNHTQLVKYMVSAGYPIDPNLNAVCDLINLIKHGSNKCGEKLLKSGPQFLTISAPPKYESGWGRAINLTEQHMSWLFDVVSNSGPTSRTMSLI
jgi:hypothetical protein